MSTINTDLITFAPYKSDRNERERGLPFGLVAELDWSDAVLEMDDRQDYGEPRYRVFGYIGHGLYAMVFTPRDGKIHVISLRKANHREVKLYEQKTQT